MLEPDSGALLIEVEGVGAALRTPPFNLIVTALAPTALDALAARLSADGEALPGVVGPSAAASYFARVWSRTQGLPARLHHAVRIFENRKVIFPTPPIDGGRMRFAGEPDLAQVLAWAECFDRDVGNSTATPRSLIEQRVRNGDFVLWETDRVV